MIKNHEKWRFFWLFWPFFYPRGNRRGTKMGPQRQCRPLIYILFMLSTLFCTFSGFFKPLNGAPKEIPKSDPVFSFLVQIFEIPCQNRSKFWGWEKFMTILKKNRHFLTDFILFWPVFGGHFRLKRAFGDPKKSSIVDPDVVSESWFFDPRPKLGHFLGSFSAQNSFRIDKNRGSDFWPPRMTDCLRKPSDGD